MHWESSPAAGCRRMPFLTVLLLSSLAWTGRLDAQLAPRPDPKRWSSGGALTAEQAAYDVQFYQLHFAVDPADSSVAGDATVHARVLAPLDWIVLDLDSAWRVRAVSDRDGSPLLFEHRELTLWIRPAAPLTSGNQFALRIRYDGRPRIAPRPPWIGGFQWARTSSGAPWIATTAVNEGADLFWPVKDHPSDKADSIAISITVPDGLVAASNGRSRGSRNNGDGTVTWQWFVSTPIPFQ